MSKRESTQVEKKTSLLVFSFALLAFLVIGGYAVWDYSHKQIKTPTDDLSKLLGVGFTFLAALATLAVSIFNAYRTITIERAKTDLSKELELFKKSITADIEFIKGKFAMDRTALQEIAGAVMSAYYALQYVENGLYDKDELKNACKNLLACLKYTVLFEQKDADTLMEFAQYTLNVKDSYDQVPQSSPLTPDEKAKLSAVWKEQGRGVSDAFYKVRTMLKSRHHEPAHAEE